MIKNISWNVSSKRKQMDAQNQAPVNKLVHSSYGTHKYLIVAVV